MKRTCLECRKPLTGRSDKKFCNTYCRTKYHGQHRGDNLRYVRKIDSILRRNRKILGILNPEGKAIVHYSDLVLLGFRFDIFTHMRQSKKGVTWYYCYDYGYQRKPDHTIKLVKKII